LAELISFSARENSAGASFGMVEHAIKLKRATGVEKRRMGFMWRDLLQGWWTRSLADFFRSGLQGAGQWFPITGENGMVVSSKILAITLNCGKYW
jgi:hypothetical protein